MKNDKELLANFTSKIKNNQMKFERKAIEIESHPVSTCEKVKEFRGNLIANVAHDLRTPLQCIIGYSETIKSKQKTITAEEQDKYLDIILKNSNKLSSMIEQFFEYSKFELSEIIPEKTSFSPKKIAQELRQSYELITSEKKIKLSIHLEDNLSNIYGDYIMLYRVFQNLIDNALKFTPENGEIIVNVSKDSKSQLQVQISDTGMGIPHDKLDCIFNKFQTVNETAIKSERNDGLGLGLAIIKKILSIHDAKITVNSEVGKGTTFTFFLPCQ